MFTLHELVFKRAALCSELGILKILTEYFFLINSDAFIKVVNNMVLKCMN